MPMSQGDFCWYELMTSDQQAAESFYTQTIGWTAADAGMPGMTYILFKVGEALAAGLMKLPDEVLESGGRPGWLVYVAVDDVNEMAERMAQDGAAIHHAPEDIPGIGRFAVIGDPQGAVFCLFHGEGEPPETPAKDTPGTIGWHELYTEDLDAGFDFYSRHFGWEKLDAMDMGPMGVYQLFGKNGIAFGGMMKRPAEMPNPAWSCYFIVDSADAAMARATGAGGQIMTPTMEVPGGMWISQGLDPQGAFFAVVSANK